MEEFWPFGRLGYEWALRRTDRWDVEEVETEVQVLYGGEAAPAFDIMTLDDAMLAQWRQVQKWGQQMQRLQRLAWDTNQFSQLHIHSG